MLLVLMYRNSENGKSDICYLRLKEMKTEQHVINCKESFPKKKMVVAGMSGRGTLPVIVIPQNVKVNQYVYRDRVLKPYFEEYLPKLYPGEMNKIIFHHDKATSHTAKEVVAYLEHLKKDIGITFQYSRDIIVKGADVSPMDFFGFGYLKQQQKKSRARTLNGMGKVWKRIWGEVSAEKCMKVLRDWKLRLKHVVDNNGGHIEHTHKIHRRKIRC